MQPKICLEQFLGSTAYSAALRVTDLDLVKPLPSALAECKLDLRVNGL